MDFSELNLKGVLQFVLYYDRVFINEIRCVKVKFYTVT